MVWSPQRLLPPSPPYLVPLRLTTQTRLQSDPGTWHHPFITCYPPAYHSPNILCHTCDVRQRVILTVWWFLAAFFCVWTFPRAGPPWQQPFSPPLWRVRPGPSLRSGPGHPLRLTGQNPSCPGRTSTQRIIWGNHVFKHGDHKLFNDCLTLLFTLRPHLPFFFLSISVSLLYIFYTHNWQEKCDPDGWRFCHVQALVWMWQTWNQTQEGPEKLDKWFFWRLLAQTAYSEVIRGKNNNILKKKNRKILLQHRKQLKHVHWKNTFPKAMNITWILRRKSL